MGKTEPRLEQGAHVHFIGICGTAMASLAGIMQQKGYRITGSDIACYPPMSDQLDRLGIEVMEGFVKGNLEPRPDFVIVGNVVMLKYEEAAHLVSTDIPYTSLPKALGDFVIEDRNSVVVAGTHGKTTTTSMMAWVMENQDLEFGYLIGGIPNNFDSSFRVVDHESHALSQDAGWFLIEGDEYDTAFFDKVPKFIHYRPKYVTMTGIEFDHADIYSDIDDVKAAFAQLVERAQGHIVAYADCVHTTETVAAAAVPVWTYGIEGGHYQATQIRYNETGCEFNVHREGSPWLVDVQLPMSGEHNILNALSALVHADVLNWDMKRAQEALRSFRGVKRRQEVIGMPGGVRVVEDFAHHPTAVKKTLAGLKKQFHEGRLFAIFEPRSATSRRRVFQQQYAESFTDADEVLIAEPYSNSQIAPEDRFSSEKLVEDLIQNGQSATCYPNINGIVERISQTSQRGDTVVIMSNGGFDGIYAKLLSSLS